MLKAAAAHRGTSIVEIYQNCPIFNDGAFELIKDIEQQKARLVHLRDGEPIAIGEDDERELLVRGEGGSVRFVAEGEVSSRGLADQVVVHDVTLTDPSQAFSISRLDSESMTHVPMGIFRSVDRPTYDDQTRAQVDAAIDLAGGPATDDDLQSLLYGNDTWTVE